MAERDDLSALLDELDQKIRRGRTVEVRQTLPKLLRADVPRALKHRLANLFRRSGLSMSAIRVLNPVIRPEGRRRDSAEATPFELAEYGAALANIGATREALKLLQSVPGTTFPQATLFEAFAHIGRWDYAAAADCLHRYVVHPGLTPYEKLLGELNLAASLIYERGLDEAEALLEHLIEGFAAQGSKLLEANAHELLAQVHFYRGDLDRAETHLDRTEGLNASSRFGLFARKWRAILVLARPGRRDDGLAELQRLAREARLQGQWEIVRDCDYRRAVATRDFALFSQLYAGTPYPSYRARVALAVADCAGGASFPPTDYAWEPFAGRSTALRSVPRLSLADGTVDGQPLDLKPEGLPHRLLRVLARDFYAPTRVATLYAELHPDAVFNPRSSPATIHQLLSRLRETLAGLPLALVARGGAYAIVAGAPIVLDVALPGGAARAPKESTELKTLRGHFGADAFGMREAQKLLGFSRRSAQRFLADAVARGALEKVGFGRSQRYRAA